MVVLTNTLTPPPGTCHECPPAQKGQHNICRYKLQPAAADHALASKTTVPIHADKRSNMPA